MVTSDKETFDERLQRRILLDWYIIRSSYEINTEYHISSTQFGTDWGCRKWGKKTRTKTGRHMAKLIFIISIS
jgi:hypothetical protein